jgi:hypothetical protein
MPRQSLRRCWRVWSRSMLVKFKNTFRSMKSFKVKLPRQRRKVLRFWRDSIATRRWARSRLKHWMIKWRILRLRKKMFLILWPIKRMNLRSRTRSRKISCKNLSKNWPVISKIYWMRSRKLRNQRKAFRISFQRFKMMSHPRSIRETPR